MSTVVVEMQRRLTNAHLLFDNFVSLADYLRITAAAHRSAGLRDPLAQSGFGAPGGGAGGGVSDDGQLWPAGRVGASSANRSPSPQAGRWPSQPHSVTGPASNVIAARRTGLRDRRHQHRRRCPRLRDEPGRTAGAGRDRRPALEWVPSRPHRRSGPRHRLKHVRTHHQPPTRRLGDHPPSREVAVGELDQFLP
jgi:hypothetical protein